MYEVYLQRMQFFHQGLPEFGFDRELSSMMMAKDMPSRRSMTILFFKFIVLDFSIKKELGGCMHKPRAALLTSRYVVRTMIPFLKGIVRTVERRWPRPKISLDQVLMTILHDYIFLSIPIFGQKITGAESILKPCFTWFLQYSFPDANFPLSTNCTELFQNFPRKKNHPTL